MPDSPAETAAISRTNGRDTPRPLVHARPIPADRIDPDAVKVIRRLTRNGHTAYLVGGGVRDLLLGRRPKDFDVATSARPNDVRSLFRNCRIIGRRFRLAHILFAGGKVIEVATFRRDPTEALETAEAEFREEMQALAEQDIEEGSGAFPGRESQPLPLLPRRKDRSDDADLLIRHDNVFGEPHEDALRRDFTINGLFYDIEREQVIDYVGGLADIEARVVRTIGEPDVRFREDPVRILRAIKFSARLDLGIMPDMMDAMVALRDELQKSARPRVLEEVLRLLRGGAAHRAFYLAWDSGTLGVILPELAAFLDDAASDADLLWGRLAAIDRRIADGALPSDAVLLAGLLEGPLEEAIEGTRDPVAAFDDFFEAVLPRLAVTRRLKDRMRLILMVQRRLRAGKIGALPRRDFFADAATLYACDCEARGAEVPEWAIEPPRVPEDVTRRRPRRARRRRA